MADPRFRRQHRVRLSRPEPWRPPNLLRRTGRHPDATRGSNSLHGSAGTYYTGRYLGGVIGASLAGAILGQAVTASGVSTGFAILAVVMVAVTIVSFGLPARADPDRDVTGEELPAEAA